MSSGNPATIMIGTEQFTAGRTTPFVFGRADGTGLTGLNPDDMGISAEAGSVELDKGVWWVVNRSAKRRLLIEDAVGQPPRTLECGRRYAVTSSPLVVLVPGAMHTHRLEVTVPEEDVVALHAAGRQSTGTLTADARLLERDRIVLAALCSGYLRSFPRRDPRPLTYQAIADRLGPPWTRVTARKQIERFRERLARAGTYFDGPRANDELAEYLVDNAILGPQDLQLLPGEGLP